MPTDATPNGLALDRLGLGWYQHALAECLAHFRGELLGFDMRRPLLVGLVVQAAKGLHGHAQARHGENALGVAVGRIALQHFLRIDDGATVVLLTEIDLGEAIPRILARGIGGGRLAVKRLGAVDILCVVARRRSG